MIKLFLIKNDFVKYKNILVIYWANIIEYFTKNKNIDFWSVICQKYSWKLSKKTDLGDFAKRPTWHPIKIETYRSDGQ